MSVSLAIALCSVSLLLLAWEWWSLLHGEKKIHFGEENGATCRVWGTNARRTTLSELGLSSGRLVVLLCRGELLVHQWRWQAQGTLTLFV